MSHRLIVRGKKNNKKERKKERKKKKKRKKERKKEEISAVMSDAAFMIE
jgi:hypothetical protein